MLDYQALFLLSGSELLIKKLGDLSPASAGVVRLEGTDLTVQLKAGSTEEAKGAATLTAEEFCDALSVRTGEYFSVQFRELIERQGSRQRLAESVFPITWRELTYRPEALPADLQAALEAAAGLSDEVLRKAGGYFRHALFLHQEAWHHVVPGSLDWQLFASDALLHYNKAASIIVGDPAIDRDHQSRYRRFGISDGLWLDTQRLRGLRNDADVAHHALDWNALERVRAEIQFTKRTSGAVIRAYAAYLLAQAAR